MITTSGEEGLEKGEVSFLVTNVERRMMADVMIKVAEDNTQRHR